MPHNSFKRDPSGGGGNEEEGRGGRGSKGCCRFVNGHLCCISADSSTIHAICYTDIHICILLQRQQRKRRRKLRKQNAMAKSKCGTIITKWDKKWHVLPAWRTPCVFRVCLKSMTSFPSLHLFCRLMRKLTAPPSLSGKIWDQKWESTDENARRPVCLVICFCELPHPHDGTFFFPLSPQVLDGTLQEYQELNY